MRLGQRLKQSWFNTHFHTIFLIGSTDVQMICGNEMDAVFAALTEPVEGLCCHSDGKTSKTTCGKDGCSSHCAVTDCVKTVGVNMNLEDHCLTGNGKNTAVIFDPTYFITPHPDSQCPTGCTQGCATGCPCGCGSCTTCPPPPA